MLFAELKFKVKTGSAKGHADKIQTFVNDMLALIPENEAEKIYFSPKIHAVDDSTIAIGQKIHFPNRGYRLSEDFHTVLNHTGQQINLEAELSTSIEDLMASTQPILKSLAEGFKFTATLKFISNMKKVLLELSKVEDDDSRKGL